jgi:hypothetical protein
VSLPNQNGRDLSTSDVVALGNVVRQIADNQSTLEDPTALAAQNPGIAPLLMRLGIQIIRNNRELAKRIVEGFVMANEVQE